MVWQKGQRGNPHNKNLKRKDKDHFSQILKRVERKHSKTLLEHAIERAYEDDTVLKAILSKIVPDKSKSIEDKVTDHKPMKIVRAESANITKENKVT